METNAYLCKNSFILSSYESHCDFSLRAFFHERYVNYEYSFYIGMISRCVIAKVQDYDIIVSEFELQSRSSRHFWFIPFGKVWTSVSPQKGFKYNFYCSSITMYLALDNPRRLICHEARNQISILQNLYRLIWNVILLSISLWH